MRAKEFITEIGFLKGLATVASIAKNITPTYLGGNGANLDVASAMTSNAQEESDAKKLAIQTAPKVYNSWVKYALNEPEKINTNPAVMRSGRKEPGLSLAEPGANLTDSKSHKNKNKISEGQQEVYDPDVFLTWIKDYIKTPQTKDLTVTNLPDLKNKANVIEFLVTQITAYNLQKTRTKPKTQSVWKQDTATQNPQEGYLMYNTNTYRRNISGGWNQVDPTTLKLLSNNEISAEGVNRLENELYDATNGKLGTRKAIS